MQTTALRSILIPVALFEAVWSVVFYALPSVALGTLGRVVVDPVIARQYPLYLASAALAYGFAASDPRRYAGVVRICVVQRLVEIAFAVADRRAGAISTPAFVVIACAEAVVAIGLTVSLSMRPAGPAVPAGGATPVPLGDRGLVRLLRGFGGLQLFWFFASTVFVQLGARLLHWKLQDPYTTQQQGVALLTIGLVSLLAASDIARYRALVWVAVASQLIGVANAFNEIRLGTIGWSGAAIQWTIECGIVAAFAWFSRRGLRATFRKAESVAE